MLLLTKRTDYDIRIYSHPPAGGEREPPALQMGESTVDEAVQRIESICAFMERYGDLGEIFEHFKELESKLFMCREMLTVEEAAEYIGVSKSQIYLMTSNREITHFKPRGKFIYIERKELDDVLRRNVIYSSMR